MAVNTKYFDMLQKSVPIKAVRFNHHNIKKTRNLIEIMRYSIKLEIRLESTKFLQITYIQGISQTYKIPNDGWFTALQKLGVRHMFPIIITVNGTLHLVLISTYCYIYYSRLYSLPYSDGYKLVVYDKNYALLTVLDIPNPGYADMIAECAYTLGHMPALDIITCYLRDQLTKDRHKEIIELVPNTWLLFLDKYLVRELLKYVAV